MFASSVESEFTGRFEWSRCLAKPSAVPCPRIREEANFGRIWKHTETNQPESRWPPAISLAITLIGFVLIAWLPEVRAQMSDSTWPARMQKATVSVRELQIPEKARSALRQGVKRFKKGDAAGSLTYFQRAIQKYPDFYEAYYDKGAAEMQLHQRSEALQSFQKAIDLSGGRYARAYFGYALALAQLGKAQDAEPIVRRGLEADSSLSDGYAVLSIVLFDENRFDEAETTAHKALQMPNPSTGKALLTLAFIHLRKQEYPSAVQDLEGYLQDLRSNPGKGDTELVQAIEKKLTEAKAKSVGRN
jgi:tetratricopeptide (TPR) repeat protein